MLDNTQASKNKRVYKQEMRENTQTIRNKRVYKQEMQENTQASKSKWEKLISRQSYSNID